MTQIKGGTIVTRIEKRYFNGTMYFGTMYFRPWIGESVGLWHPFQGFSGRWNHTNPWGRPIFG